MTSAPFVSIVTRCSQRPRGLLRAVRSVTQQTDLDAEHIFLVDDEHRGLKFANKQFYRYRNIPRGDYVWLLDDDDLANEPTFIERVKETVRETGADVVVVKTIHEHTGLVHPQPELWNIAWEEGKRPESWTGGGYCVVVKREVWKQNLENYFEGQGKHWQTGGDWHFITSLIEDKTLQFARCDVIAGKQPERGYGRKTERCDDDWFDRIAEKLNLEHVKRRAYRLDYRTHTPSWVEIPNVSIKQPLHILQCAQWDWAGCAAMLCEAINEHTIHTCRAIRWKEEGAFNFPVDVVAPSRDELADLWEWADVVHIHDSAPVKRLRPKPTIITMHGSKYRKSPAKYQRIISQRGWYLTVATPDLTEIHDAPWMPDTRTGLPQRTASESGFVALHCPSIRANKGTKHVIAEMQKIPMIDFRLIEDVSWRECLRIKASVSEGVLIDQFEWGYGCNAIEAWAYGIPVISNAVGPARRAFEGLFGYFPFLPTQPSNLANAVLSLTDPRQYKRIQDIGVGHYKRYHEPSATAAIAVEFYDTILSSQTSKTTQQISDGPIGSDGLTLIRYLGGNYGTTTWFGPVTDTEYRFSAADRLKYVDDRDVPGLLNIERHTNRMFEVVD